jgi:formylmethanofuran dehydrogenase subunit C
MAVTLSLRSAVQIPIELEGVLPERLRASSLDAILQTPVTQGNVTAPVGEFFTATGSCTDDLTLVLQGDLHAVKAIGRGMTCGRIVIEGNAGMHLGAGMSGGIMDVHGSVGDWAGAEMRGGLIRINGSAGDCLAGAYRGSRRGMTGGEILVSGDAGHEVARVMRRGLVAIAGGCGDYCGSRMIAGSIFVCGPAGRRAGAGMKRGTIGLLGEPTPEMLPTFQRAGEFRAAFLEGYARRLEAAGFMGSNRLRTGRFQRWCGDVLTLGKGEILTPAG